MRAYLAIFLCFLSSGLFAAHRTLNVYGWGGELPRSLIRDFEQETGINIYFSTYDSNETLYAKLHATKQQPVYDVIMPSAYFVERLKNQKFLEKLDKTKLPHLKNIDRSFNGQDYDAFNEHSVPLIWGITGLFYNSKWIKNPPTSWEALWNPGYKHTLMLIDDPREVFGMALLTLGYSPNDINPAHITQAYEKLQALAPNIKLFASDGIKSLMIDEEVHIGPAYNGDAFKAQQENLNIKLVYPEEGYAMWIDCLSIMKNAPHREEAYIFIDFLLRAKSAATIAKKEGHAITNRAGIALLPETTRNNLIIYPPKEVIERSIVQRDMPNNILRLYNYYWQQLKFSL